MLRNSNLTLKRKRRSAAIESGKKIRAILKNQSTPEINNISYNRTHKKNNNKKRKRKDLKIGDNLTDDQYNDYIARYAAETVKEKLLSEIKRLEKKIKWLKDEHTVEIKKLKDETQYAEKKYQQLLKIHSSAEHLITAAGDLEQAETLNFFAESCEKIRIAELEEQLQQLKNNLYNEKEDNLRLNDKSSSLQIKIDELNIKIKESEELAKKQHNQHLLLIESLHKENDNNQEKIKYLNETNTNLQLKLDTTTNSHRVYISQLQNQINTLNKTIDAQKKLILDYMVEKNKKDTIIAQQKIEIEALKKNQEKKHEEKNRNAPEIEIVPPILPVQASANIIEKKKEAVQITFNNDAKKNQPITISNTNTTPQNVGSSTLLVNQALNKLQPSVPLTIPTEHIPHLRADDDIIPFKSEKTGYLIKFITFLNYSHIYYELTDNDGKPRKVTNTEKRYYTDFAHGHAYVHGYLIVREEEKKTISNNQPHRNMSLPIAPSPAGVPTANNNSIKNNTMFPNYNPSINSKPNNTPGAPQRIPYQPPPPRLTPQLPTNKK